MYCSDPGNLPPTAAVQNGDAHRPRQLLLALPICAPDSVSASEFEAQPEWPPQQDDRTRCRIDFQRPGYKGHTGSRHDLAANGHTLADTDQFESAAHIWTYRGPDEGDLAAVAFEHDQFRTVPHPGELCLAYVGRNAVQRHHDRFYALKPIVAAAPGAQP